VCRRKKKIYCGKDRKRRIKYEKNCFCWECSAWCWHSELRLLVVDDKPDDENNTDPKKITITGITVEDKYYILVSLLSDEGDSIAIGADTISSNSVTVSLKNNYDNTTD
jgi:hypothetical protein